jgi:hypothetical protein
MAQDCTAFDVELFEHGAPIRQTLAISAVQGYVMAIVDLWSFQKKQEHEPTLEALNNVLRTRQWNEHRRRRLEFTDRAAGTVQDGYDETKTVKAVRFC